MPLFRGSLPCPAKGEIKKKKKRKGRWKAKEAEGHGTSLANLCLWSLAENMKDLWTRDYAENYMDQYSFLYIMGPFNVLPGDLVEELMSLLSSHQMLTRSALHLLLVPQVRHLSLSSCSSLVTPSICNLIGIRCQALLSLDLSGAQHLSALVLSELLGQLARLRSICLTGTQCDDRVLHTISDSCPALQHLDISCCHQLAPTGLLHLVAWPFGHKGLCLKSLLALDIDLEYRESYRVGVAVILLLSMPSLEKVAIEGLGEACALIENQDFSMLDGFTFQSEVPNFWELLRNRTQGEQSGRCERAVEEECLKDEEIDGWLPESEDYDEDENEQQNESDEKGKWKDKGKSEPRSSTVEELERTCQNGQQTEGGQGASRGSLTLSLREAQGVSCSKVNALGVLCPDLCALSLHCEEDLVGNLPAAMGQWKGQLVRLGLQCAGLLPEILPAVIVVGSTLHSLTLEGVRMDGDASFLLLLRSCPNLKTLLIHTEPPRINQEEEEENNEQDVQGLPCLPQLRLLSLKFFMEQQQKKPLMSWRSLKWAIVGLLGGAPVLEKATLMAMPCPMDAVFQKVLENRIGSPEDPGISPLRNLRHLSLAYCNISMETATRLVTRNGLSTLDLSGCWNVSSDNIVQLEREATRRRYPLTIIWR